MVKLPVGFVYPLQDVDIAVLFGLVTHTVCVTGSRTV